MRHGTPGTPGMPAPRRSADTGIAAVGRFRTTERMTISKVGVVGCGLMGSGIAQVVAQSGYQTTVVEADQGLLDRGLQSIQRGLDALVDKGRLAAEQRDAALGTPDGDAPWSRTSQVWTWSSRRSPRTRRSKKETFARLDRDLPAARRPGVEHLVVHDHRSWPPRRSGPRRCSGCTSSIPPR